MRFSRIVFLVIALLLLRAGHSYGGPGKPPVFDPPPFPDDPLPLPDPFDLPFPDDPPVPWDVPFDPINDLPDPIDLPLPPEDPISPNPPLVLAVGLLLSLGLAAGAVALLESTDGTVRGRKDMLEAFAAPLLVVVPRILTAADIALGRRRLRYTVGTITAVGIAVIAAVHFFYRPLDVLWFAAMRRLGY